MWKKRFNEYIDQRVSSGHLFLESTDNATDRIVQNAMRDVWDLAYPRDFQVEAVKRLAFFPMEAYHLDEQNNESARELSKRLNTLHQTEANHCTIFLYLSPSALQLESSWLKLLEKIAKRGYLRLICIDEAHSIEQDGRSFRPEFVSAAQNLMMLHNMMPTKCSIVCMSATFRMSDQNTVSGILK
jgi:superfamily II DNA helicase RecQ